MGRQQLHHRRGGSAPGHSAAGPARFPAGVPGSNASRQPGHCRCASRFASAHSGRAATRSSAPSTARFMTVRVRPWVSGLDRMDRPDRIGLRDGNDEIRMGHLPAAAEFVDPAADHPGPRRPDRICRASPAWHGRRRGTGTPFRRSRSRGKGRFGVPGGSWASMRRVIVAISPIAASAILGACRRSTSPVGRVHRRSTMRGPATRSTSPFSRGPMPGSAPISAKIGNRDCGRIRKSVRSLGRQRKPLGQPNAESR